MKPLAIAVIRSGIISKDSLAQFAKWGMPVHVISEEDIIDDTDVLLSMIKEALDGPDQVALRDTDLDILKLWLDVNRQRKGKLIVADGKDKATRTIIYCLSPLGEYIIPWTSEDISFMMLNPESYLVIEDEEGNKSKVYFAEVREIYIGAHKSFMACMPVGRIQNVG